MQKSGPLFVHEKSVAEIGAPFCTLSIAAQKLAATSPIVKPVIGAQKSVPPFVHEVSGAKIGALFCTRCIVAQKSAPPFVHEV